MLLSGPCTQGDTDCRANCRNRYVSQHEVEGDSPLSRPLLCTRKHGEARVSLLSRSVPLCPFGCDSGLVGMVVRALLLNGVESHLRL